jgi:hypothetical protein
VLDDGPLLVAVLAVSVSASAPSWSDGIGLELAWFFGVSGYHTGKTFDFLKSYDTFKFVL